MTEHITTAKQGHAYRLGDKEVISMENGVVVRVRELNRNDPYPLGKELTVKASWLTAMPMRYFHNETPA
jgi:hypothetical protein